MKKLVLTVLVLMIVSIAFAKLTTYAQMRMGWWYEMQDEEMTGGESRMVMQNNLYSNSRFGVKFNMDKVSGQFELGAKPSLSLRVLYGQYDLGFGNLILGKTFTGFSDFAEQSVTCTYGFDDLMIGYGMAYDSTKNQIGLTLNNGFYLKMMEGAKIDPWGDPDGIDNLIPKFNFGYKYKKDNLYLHPTFGITMSNYNIDFSDYDDSMTAYVFAFSGKMNFDKKYIKFQVNYGQNVRDYGLLGDQIPFATVTTDTTTTIEIVDITTYSGYINLGMPINEKMELKAGFGYVSSDSDLMADPNTAMSAYLQCKHYLTKSVMIIPEVGMIDNMESGILNSDGSVDDEGSVIYFGAKFQYSFSFDVE